jgi:hypothetical protein
VHRGTIARPRATVMMSFARVPCSLASASTYDMGFADTRSTGPFGITNLIFLNGRALRLIPARRPALAPDKARQAESRRRPAASLGAEPPVLVSVLSIV